MVAKMIVAVHQCKLEDGADDQSDLTTVVVVKMVAVDESKEKDVEISRMIEFASRIIVDSPSSSGTPSMKLHESRWKMEIIFDATKRENYALLEILQTRVDR